MSTNLVTSAWGYIGKMPAKGDFVKDGLSQDFSERWHDWLQAVIAVSREQLGESWNEHFLTAPVWHFALDVSYLEDSTYIGSMIPSVDACGRYFFFTIARAVKGEAAQYWEDKAWTEDSASLALAVLEDDFVFDVWHKSMQEKNDLVANVKSEVRPLKFLYQSQISTIFHDLGGADQSALLNYLIKEKLSKPCFWWTEGSTLVEPCMFMTSGFPSIGQFSAMLDGGWKKWNW